MIATPKDRSNPFCVFRFPTVSVIFLRKIKQRDLKGMKKERLVIIDRSGS
jgi:hypothetical protein